MNRLKKLLPLSFALGLLLGVSLCFWIDSQPKPMEPIELIERHGMIDTIAIWLGYGVLSVVAFIVFCLVVEVVGLLVTGRTRL